MLSGHGSLQAAPSVCKSREHAAGTKLAACHPHHRLQRAHPCWFLGLCGSYGETGIHRGLGASGIHMPYWCVLTVQELIQFGLSCCRAEAYTGARDAVHTQILQHCLLITVVLDSIQAVGAVHIDAQTLPHDHV